MIPGLFMHNNPVLSLLLRAALLLSAGCVAPSPSPHDPALIEPVVGEIDADLQNISGFTAESLHKLLVAELAGANGQFREALRGYLDVAATTGDPGILERATRIALYIDDDAAAREAAELWLQHDPNSVAAHQILGSLDLQAGDEPAAIRHFHAIVNDTGPLLPRLWLIVGALNRDTNRDRVLDVLDRLMRRPATKPETVMAYAEVLVRLEDLDRAASTYELVIDRDLTHVEAILARLSIFQATDSQAEAEQWLAQLLQRVPEGEIHDVVRLQYAQQLTRTDKLLQAIEHLEILLDEQPDHGEALLSAGLLYLELSRNAEASHSFHRLVELEKHIHEAGYFLGWLAEQQDDYDTAWQWYNSIPGGHRYPAAQIRMAVIQARRGELQPARTRLAEIATDDPEQRNQVVQAEAELLLELEMPEAAMQIYDHAIGDNYDSELLYGRALLAERIKRLDVLEQDLSRIIAREPNNAQALNALGYTLADLTDRYDEAYGLIKRALLLNPESFYILDSMGWVLYRLGRLAESEDYLRRSIRIKFDPVAAAHLVEVLWNNGSRREARKILGKARRLHPGNATVESIRARLQ